MSPFILEYIDHEERLREEYMLFLMRHYEDLGLPYDFEMTLSFIGIPMLEGNALVARERGTGTVIGAAGFVFGTGPNRYEDKTVCQVETVYIVPRWRNTRLFPAMLLSFASYLGQNHPQVERIQFWSPTDQKNLVRFFEKFSTCVKESDKSFGQIRLYQTDIRRIYEACSKVLRERRGRSENQLA